MHDIEAISFDLDDSLWAIAPVIIRAEKIMHQYMDVHFPAVTKRFDADGLRQVRESVSERYPHLAYDLTAMRQLSLVDQSGWQSGNSLALIVSSVGNSEGEVRTAYSYNGDSDSAPRLYVEFVLE